MKEKSKRLAFIKNASQYYGLIIILILMFAGFSIANKNFFTLDNLIAILKQSSIYGVIGLGMGILIINHFYDLSVGAILGMSGAVLAMITSSGLPVVLGVMAALVVGTILGTLNGIGVAFTGIPAFILTMATTQVFRGLVYIITGGMPISGLPDSLLYFGKGYVGILPIAVVVMIIVYIISYIFMNYTETGRNIFATGGNSVAARYSGINVKWTVILTFAISGFLAAIGGILLVAKLQSAQPAMGNGYEMDAIAAAAIGGVSLDGGEGSVLGMFLGAIILGVINNGMVMVGFDSYWQMVAKGVIIILAVGIDVYRKKLQS